MISSDQMRRLSSGGFTSGVSVLLLLVFVFVIFQLEKATGATPVAKKSCIVKNINVQKGFNLGRVSSKAADCRTRRFYLHVLEN